MQLKSALLAVEHCSFAVIARGMMAARTPLGGVTGIYIRHRFPESLRLYEDITFSKHNLLGSTMIEIPAEPLLLAPLALEAPTGGRSAFCLGSLPIVQVTPLAGVGLLTGEIEPFSSRRIPLHRRNTMGVGHLSATCLKIAAARCRSAK